MREKDSSRSSMERVAARRFRAFTAQIIHLKTLREKSVRFHVQLRPANAREVRIQAIARAFSDRQLGLTRDAQATGES
jgi:hypothetical protein